MIAIGDDVGIDIGVEDVDDGIIDVLILGALLGIKIMENKIIFFSGIQPKIIITPPPRRGENRKCMR